MRAATVCLAIALSLASLHSLQAGELRTDEITSKALGRTVNLHVLLPDGYDAEADRRYPAVYLLHGYGGDYREWVRVGVVDEAKGLPVIIAMPEGDQSFYINHHGDPQGRWEDYIFEEVIPHVDSKYRTRAERASRAVSGLSMGGYGALMLGLRHPDLFASIASHSGALGILSRELQGGIGQRIAKIFGPEGSEERRKYDLVSLVEKLPEKDRPHIYLDCGSGDFLLEDNRSFVRELSSIKVDYEYREVPGAHDFRYWKANVRYSLDRQLEALLAARSGAKSARPVAPDRDDPREDAAKDAIAKVAGDWKLIVKFPDLGREVDYTLKIRKAEDSKSGLAAVLVSPRSGEHPFRKAAVDDGALKLEIERTILGREAVFFYEGKLSNAGLSGSVVAKVGDNEIKGTWTARKD